MEITRHSPEAVFTHSVETVYVAFYAHPYFEPSICQLSALQHMGQQVELA